MLNDVQCPKCGAKLRSVNDLTGKTIKCKKCDTRFRAEADAGDQLDDTAAMSAYEIMLPPIPPPAPAVKAAPVAKVPIKHILNQDDDLLELDAAVLPAKKKAAVIEEDEEPDEKPKKKKKKKADDDEDTFVGSADATVSAPFSNAFSFDDPEPAAKKKKKKRDDDDEDEDEDERPKKKKKKKSDDEDDDGKPLVRPSYQTKKGPPVVLFLVLGLGFLILVGGGIAAFVLLGKKNEVAKTTPTTGTNTPAPPTSAPSTKPVGTEPTTTETTKPVTKPTTARPTRGPVIPPVSKGNNLPKAPSPTAKGVSKAEHAISSDIPPDMIKAFRTSKSGNPHKVVIAKSSFAGFMGTGATDSIERFEGDTGAKAGAVEVNSDGCHWPRPFEISPDGKHFLIEGPAGKLTLGDFDAKTKLLDGVDPFEGQAGRTGPMTGCGWLGGDKFFVVDRNGSADIWSVKDKKLATSGVTVNPPAPEGAKIVGAAVGSAGKYVVVARENQFVTTMNGQPAVSNPIAYANAGAVPVAVAGEISGTKVAILAHTGGDNEHTLFLGDTLGKDKRTTIVLPSDLGQIVDMTWQSQDSVLITIEGGKAALLVDTEVNAVVGYIKNPEGGQVFAKGMFPYVWWAIADPKDPKKTLITSAKLDFDDYVQMRIDAKKNRAPAFLVPRGEDLAK